jgi:arabinose-5-phosphate isomerase
MSNNKKYLINDLLIPISKIPVLREKNILKEALEEMMKYKFGICFCINKNGKLSGILTDGDVRRKILNVQKPFSALLGDDLALHINKKPKKVHINSNLDKAFKIMKKNSIWDLPVIDKNNKLQGMLHLHPVVKFFLNK